MRLRGLNLSSLIHHEFGTCLWINTAFHVTPSRRGRGFHNGAQNGADFPHKIVVCSAGREPPGNPVELICDGLPTVGETAHLS